MSTSRLDHRGGRSLLVSFQRGHFRAEIDRIGRQEDSRTASDRANEHQGRGGHAHRAPRRCAAPLEERLAAGSAWKDTGLVFTTRIGTAIEPRRIHREFKGLLAKAKLPITTRFHDLRHGIASLLIALGKHPRVVMEWMRHSQISLTMNTYSHVMPTMLRDVADEIDRALGSNPMR